MDVTNASVNFQSVIDDKDIVVEDLGMPGMTKAVSIPEASKAPPTKRARAFVGNMPRMVATSGDRSVPLPLLKLEQEFNVDEICCLTFTSMGLQYKEKYINAGEAIKKCARIVGNFTDGPAYSLSADTKCDDFKCDACYQQKDDDENRGKSSNKATEDSEPSECSAKVKWNTKLTFDQGIHRGTYKGKPIAVVIYVVGEPQGTLREVRETYRYTLVAAKGEQELLQEFMEECLEVFKKMSVIRKRPETFCIYRWSSCQRRWSMDRVCKARPMSTVILPKDTKDTIVGDLDKFLQKRTADWYQKHGVPYKRSYLFYGLPGCGKTSLITALAGKHKRNVCFVTLSDEKMNDRQLTMAMNQLPRDPFIVFEDVDSIFNKDRSQSVRNHLTFSGLLNALDGIGYKFGSVFFMTTNFVDRLDSALLRAGRSDVKVEFTKATDEQLKLYFEKFYVDTTEKGPLEEASAEFVKCTKERFPEGVTLSTMQQHFINHMDDDAMACAKGILDFEVNEKDQDGGQEKKKADGEEEKGDEKAEEKDPSAGVKKFLKSLRLDAHLEAFLAEGYDDLDTMELAEVQDFIDLGVKKSKAKLLQSKLAGMAKARKELEKAKKAAKKKKAGPQGADGALPEHVQKLVDAANLSKTPVLVSI